MDLDIKRTRTCERCKTVVILEKVRLLQKNSQSDQNLLLCEPCCNEVKKNKTAPGTTKAKAVSSSYAHYFCNRCRYNFKADNSRIGVTHNLSCPYCGKIDQLEQRPSKQEVPTLVSKTL